MAYQTDIVLAPIAGEHPPAEPTAPGWRGKTIATIRRWLAGKETRLAWQEHTRHLTQAILDLARHDPGSRILVVVNVRHCHTV